MTLRDLQRKIADDVEEYLNNTARRFSNEATKASVMDYITMDDIKLAIQTSDVGQMINDYTQEQ